MLHHVTLWFNRDICFSPPVQFPRNLMNDCTIRMTHSAGHAVKVECFHHGKDFGNQKENTDVSHLKVQNKNSSADYQEQSSESSKGIRKMKKSCASALDPLSPFTHAVYA